MRRYNLLSDFNMRRHYIITKPRKISDIKYEDMVYGQDDFRWVEKARRLQARRWRKLKHEMV